jgi:hypothetical protein
VLSRAGADQLAQMVSEESTASPQPRLASRLVDVRRDDSKPLDIQELVAARSSRNTPQGIAQ